MLRLDSTLRKLQIVLAGAITTNQLPVVVCFSDKTSTTYNGGTTVSNTNSTTAVDICAAPGASTIRDIDSITVQNADTASATITIRYNDNGTTYSLFKCTLSVGDQIIYTHGQGWKVLDSSGALKSLSSDTVTLAGVQTLTNKTITLGSNTVSGTKAQFDIACTDGNFSYDGHEHPSSQISGISTTPATGYVGEIITATGGSISLTSVVPVNGSSLSVPVGVWDIQAVAGFSVVTGPSVVRNLSLSLTSATLDFACLVSAAYTQTVGFQDRPVTPLRRLIVTSGTTTVYAVVRASFSGGSMTCDDSIISARRVA